MTSTKTPAQLFRKKPVVVEAVQFTEAVRDAHLFDGYPLPDGVVRGATHLHPPTRKVWRATFYIETLEGRMSVEVGDWIITGVKGEHYPCKPDIFAATYEEAQSAEPVAPSDRILESISSLVRDVLSMPGMNSRTAPDYAVEVARWLSELEAIRVASPEGKLGMADYQRGYSDAIDAAAVYVSEHCVDGEAHAECVRGMERPSSVTESEPTYPELLNALAQCRDAFPMPADGPLANLWAAAVADPLCVPDYIKACVTESEPAAARQTRTTAECEWTEDDPNGYEPGTYDSACGEKWSFIDGGVTENGVKFCQNCGKPVKVIAFPVDLDEDEAVASGTTGGSDAALHQVGAAGLLPDPDMSGEGSKS